ncbi:ABC transporter substrate-binding protein [Rhodopseudomonas pseudopalustris]|uniref:Amino acid/amide ABC transporter substrate-binding protein, HAAT family n=1 Tax=Rhodopseudomonas pseudopalustris TaxID=1513892 RepID=A0A1H8M2C0_9BRAD|nr:ABC transporter substrate-binding protein [Rhodopseudomonas pseudopalustris]SEO11517.1 amino acid/amide ABC transporter substrate-binding protein, HAAT family [Rhodopseudomonas pseudopalustris]
MSELRRLPPISRRALLTGAAGAATFAVAPRFATPAIAQAAPLKVGLMLPYTGTFAKLGQFIDDGFRLRIEQLGGKLGGREVTFVQVDDESKPEAATDNMNRLVGREKVDVVIGTVHSGVAMAMVKVARDSGTLLIIPNAGANDATGPACAPNIFRTSFSNWQTTFPMGKVMADAGIKNVVTITWKYTAGAEMVGAFAENFTKNGGKIVEDLTLPFPQVEFQALITRIAQLKPDAVFSFFAGGGAVKFVKDYAAAGLNKSIPLYGAGFLTDGTIEAQGEAANGIKTTLHYADNLDNPANVAFLKAFKAKTSKDGDIYAVQGYDAAALLDIGLTSVKGDAAARDAMIKAMAAARIDSPRGPLSFNKAHNPIQNIYLREVRNGRNEMVSVAQAEVDDPARGCRMT